MTVLRSKFIASNGANHKGTQVEFSRALTDKGVEYSEVQWLGNIQIYTMHSTPVAWWYSNRGYCKALGVPAWAA